MKKLLAVLLAAMMLCGVFSVGAGAISIADSNAITDLAISVGCSWLLYDNDYFTFVSTRVSSMAQRLIAGQLGGAVKPLELKPDKTVLGFTRELAELNYDRISNDDAVAKLRDGSIGAYITTSAAKNDTLSRTLYREYFTEEALQAAEQYALSLETYFLLYGWVATLDAGVRSAAEARAVALLKKELSYPGNSLYDVTETESEAVVLWWFSYFDAGAAAKLQQILDTLKAEFGPGNVPTPEEKDVIQDFFNGLFRYRSSIAEILTLIVKYIFFGWLWGRWL